MEKHLNSAKPMRRRPWAAGIVVFLVGSLIKFEKSLLDEIKLKIDKD